MKKIIIASCVTLCASSFVLAQENADQVQPQAKSSQPAPVAVNGALPQLTTGDKAIDEKLKALFREREEKLRAINEEYQAKIKALIGDKIYRMMPPQMASGTPVMRELTDEQKKELEKRMKEKAKENMGEHRGFYNGERNGSDNGEKRGVSQNIDKSNSDIGRDAVARPEAREMFFRLKSKIFNFLKMEENELNAQNKVSPASSSTATQSTATQ